MKAKLTSMFIVSAIALAIAILVVAQTPAELEAESSSLNKEDVYRYGLKSIK